SRGRVFVCTPAGPKDEEDCAKKILAVLLRRAYRQPVDAAQLEKSMKFYRQGRADGDFAAGIDMALSAVLVNPQFLFRVERDHAGPPPLPRRRRQSAAGLSARDGAFFRERCARGPKRARPLEGGLHLPQRTPREPLRHPTCLRRALSPRRAREGPATGRPAAS